MSKKHLPQFALVAILLAPIGAAQTLTGLTLAPVPPATGTFNVGASITLQPTTVPAVPAPAPVYTWNVVKPDDGTATVDQTGKVTGVKIGTAIIEVDETGSGFKARYTVTVMPIPPTPSASTPIQFIGKLQGGSMAVTVQGKATDTVTLYQFNSAYTALGGSNTCSQLDLANADQIVSVLSGGSKQTTFTLSANTPQTIALNTPLIAGTQLCAVQSVTASPAPSGGGAASQPPLPGAGDYSTLATVVDPGSYGRFTTYFTSGAVITNQQTSGTTSTASEYLDLNFDYSWARAGVMRLDRKRCVTDTSGKRTCTIPGTLPKYHRGPGVDAFFAARLSTIPVAATATTNSTVTTTTPATTTTITNTNLNVLTTQQSAHIVLGGYLPFVFTRWNNKSYVMTLAPIATAGFDTLLNPSITPAAATAAGAGTTPTGTAQTTTSVNGNFSSVYSFYNSGLRIAWEAYPKSTDFAPMTWIELRATIGKYSNLPTYICSATPRGPYTTSSTGPVVTPIANSACGKGIYSLANLNLLYDSRTLFQRVDIQAKAQFPNYPFVLGLDANLAQYSIGRNKAFVDYQNKAGNDVRIYIGVTFNLLSAINKLNVGSF